MWWHILSSPLQVVHGMVAVGVAAPFDFLKHFGVLSHIVADHEEGGFDVVAVKHVEHPRRLLGDRAVVKSEIDDLFSPVEYTPYSFG